MTLTIKTRKGKTYDSFVYYMPLILLFSLMLILGLFSLWLMSFSSPTTFFGEIYQDYNQSNYILDYATTPLGIGFLICTIVGICIRTIDLAINYKSYTKKLLKKFPNFDLYAFLIILFFITGFIGLWLMSFKDPSTFLGDMYQTYKHSTGLFNNIMYPFIIGICIWSPLGACIGVLQKLRSRKQSK